MGPRDLWTPGPHGPGHAPSRDRARTPPSILRRSRPTFPPCHPPRCLPGLRRPRLILLQAPRGYPPRCSSLLISRTAAALGVATGVVQSDSGHFPSDLATQHAEWRHDTLRRALAGHAPGLGQSWPEFVRTVGRLVRGLCRLGQTGSAQGKLSRCYSAALAQPPSRLL